MSVLVPVPCVSSVAVPVVHVVGVVLVRNGRVTAVCRVLGVLRRRTLVRVVTVNAVNVPVVDVVDVVAVCEGDVAAALAVRVRVVGVRTVLGGDRHLTLPFFSLCPRRLTPSQASEAGSVW